MNEPLGLRPLLAALRHTPVRVGPHEVLRLRQVSLAGPRLLADAPPGEPPLSDAQREERQRERLRAILAAVLVKRAEDRDAFDRVFDAWYAAAQGDLAVRSPLRERGGPREVPHGPPGKPPGPPPSPWPLGARHAWWLAAAAMVVLGIAVWFFIPHTPEPGPVVGPVEQEPPQEKPASPRPRERDTERTFLPEILVEPAATRWTGWPALLLGLLGLGITGTIWRRLRRRSWLPRATLGAPRPGGPPQTFLRAPDPDAVALLVKPQEERLVWGIERFVTEELTRRLDLPATVRESARQGGLPALRFQHAVRHREVWLWTDTATRDTQAERLAAEVAGVLDAYGLDCERAEFRGIPEHLRTPGGHTFGPREVDERRDSAVAGYLRYMDDLVLFADSDAWLESCRADIADWLARERGLRLKDPEAPILPNTQPATFLGFRVSRTGVLPGPKMKRRLRVRLAGADALAAGRLARGLIAYRGVLAPF